MKSLVDLNAQALRLKPVCVSFLDFDHMLVVSIYADRADIELVSYDKIKCARTAETFRSLFSQYKRMHEDITTLYDAHDYFVTSISPNDLRGFGVRLIRKFIPINNLYYHLGMIQRKFEEGTLL